MAKYGVDLYGTALYGDPDPLIYSATPFTSEVINFGIIDLSWRKPGGTWTGLRLVRNYFGHPVESNDGDILVDGDGGSLSYFRDSTVLQGRWVYYSIFVYIPADAGWFRVGQVTVHSPDDYGGRSVLYDRIPRIYKGSYGAASGGAPDNPALSAFLGLIGFQFDGLRSLTDSLLDLDDPYLMNYDLVDARLAEFSIPTERALPPLQYRQFLNSAVWLYKTKGTAPCIQALCSIVMGCNSTIGIGSNLLWTADLSDFVGGVGEWMSLSSSAPILAWKPGLPNDFGVATQNYLSATSSSTAAFSIQFADSSSITGLGIPVTVGIPVTAQAVVTGTTNNTDTAMLRFQFYGPTGIFIASSDGGVVTLRNGIGSIVGVTANPPAGSAYVSLLFIVDPTVTATEFRISTVQVNYGNTVLPHQPGRDIQIYLEDSGLTALQVAVREARLRDILPRYLPLGATYTLVHNSPPPPPASFTDDIILYGT